MMNVIDKAEKKAIVFEDLKIGDVYRDSDGLICIKVSTDCDAEYNALTYGYIEVDRWEPTFEVFNAEVFPVEADLIIK